MKWFQTWLLASTGFITSRIMSDRQWRHLLFHKANYTALTFFFYSRRSLLASDILEYLNHWKKIILVCFCYTAQWGWDSLHPQINLEGPALSAFYEENPPGDESWEYSQWQGRSCETGWFWPGLTFDGELWFHWAFHSLKVNIIKSGLP